MEQDRFDRLVARLAATRLSRSRVLRGAVASILGFLVVPARDPSRAAGTAQHKARRRHRRMREQQADPANGKVTICHATGSARNAYTLITVSRSALAAHEQHGDFPFVDCCVDSDCDAGETCNQETGTCEAACVNPGGLRDGSQCTLSSQCCTGCCFHRAESMRRDGTCGFQPDVIGECLETR